LRPENLRPSPPAEDRCDPSKRRRGPNWGSEERSEKNDQRGDFERSTRPLRAAEAFLSEGAATWQGKTRACERAYMQAIFSPGEHVPAQVVVRELPVGIVAAAQIPEVADPIELRRDLLACPRVHLSPVRPRREAVDRRLDDRHGRGHVSVVVR